MLPTPLAGQFVVPAVRTGAGGHAWLWLDEHCHLHYEIAVAGLGRADDGTVSAHLHGVAELAGRSREPKRLLKGFYGTEVGTGAESGLGGPVRRSHGGGMGS